MFDSRSKLEVSAETVGDVPVQENISGSSDTTISSDGSAVAGDELLPISARYCVRGGWW